MFKSTAQNLKIFNLLQTMPTKNFVNWSTDKYNIFHLIKSVWVKRFSINHILGKTSRVEKSLVKYLEQFCHFLNMMEVLGLSD